MNAIAAVDRNWGIGYRGGMLAHLPGDLAYFKEKTIGNTIILGRATFDSMGGRLLPGRETVILSRDPDFSPGCPSFTSLEETMGFLKSRHRERLFVAGGEDIYELFLPLCDRFFITKLHGEFTADRFFPNLDKNPGEFEVIWSSGMMEENSVKYQFFEYVRV